MRATAQTFLILGAAVAQVIAQEPEAFGLFDHRTIWAPEEDGGRASYARFTELEDGTLLVTTSVFPAGGLSADAPAILPSFPVFESKDGGVTWDHISNITDQVNGWGMGAQPALYEMTEDLGPYEKGTILASGNSWSFAAEGEVGTKIDLYASTDKGMTWEFVSNVAEGGRPNTTNGATPIWEPWIMAYDGKLAVYYSDQRDPEHGQKLAHQESTDMKEWGPVIDDAAYDLYIARPGMTVIAHIETIDKWILVYELPIGNSSSYGVNYPVHYRISDSPLEFQSAEAIPIIIGNQDRTIAPNASPYVVWSSVGSEECGTLVVSDADSPAVYTNSACGDINSWEMHNTPQPSAYSRALHIFNDRPDHLMILGGSTFDAGGDPSLTLSVISLTDLLAGKYDVAEMEEPAMEEPAMEEPAMEEPAMEDPVEEEVVAEEPMEEAVEEIVNEEVEVPTMPEMPEMPEIPDTTE